MTDPNDEFPLTPVDPNQHGRLATDSDDPGLNERADRLKADTEPHIRPPDPPFGESSEDKANQ